MRNNKIIRTCLLHFLTIFHPYHGKSQLSWVDIREAKMRLGWREKALSSGNNFFISYYRKVNLKKFIWQTEEHFWKTNSINGHSIDLKRSPLMFMSHLIWTFNTLKIFCNGPRLATEAYSLQRTTGKSSKRKTIGKKFCWPQFTDMAAKAQLCRYGVWNE